MYEFLLPVIQSSTDVSQPHHVYLIEDGLELWHVTLLNAPAITPELLDLYKNMPDLLGRYQVAYRFPNERIFSCTPQQPQVRRK